MAILKPPTKSSESSLREEAPPPGGFPNQASDLTQANLLLAPKLPASVEEMGIPENFLANLVLKLAFYLEIFTLPDMTSRSKLSSTLVLHLIDYLRREKYVEIKGAGGLDGAVTAISQQYRYALTEAGKRRAAQLFEFDNYVGPVPVTLAEYWQQVERQSIRGFRINRQRLEEGFAGLVIAESLLDQLGPAVVSGKPIFIYGPPGNGKTVVSLRLGSLMEDAIMVPYAIYVEGNVIRVFDAVTHRPVQGETESLFKTDPRWIRCHRPAVLVGGEMTLDMLDLAFNPILKYYEAPLQLKANNGLFIVDDFGRQRLAPQEMLNRWIIPMENRRDFLCLHTGYKFSIPFDQLLIFSTNLEPETLVDAAFLRRLRHKIKLDHISREQFLAIFRLVCRNYGLAYNDDAVQYLMARYYDSISRPMDACHPRDLVEQIIDISRYLDVQPELSPENLDRACKTYFVE